MSRNKHQIRAVASAVAPVSAPKSKSSRIIFEEDQFYNDPKTPLFKAGVEYEISNEGNRPGWIQRWLKRGGKIIETAPGEESKVTPPAEQAVLTPGDELDGLL